MTMPVTTLAQLTKTATAFPDRKAVSFQLLSGATDPCETLTWSELLDQSTQCANMFRDMGIGENDVVAYLLPNATETILTYLGGQIAGIVNPINPLLEADQIAAILRETNAKVLVTLKGFPKTDVPQKAAEAVRLAPNVKTILEVDLNRYLTPPKSWIVPMIRPKVKAEHRAKVLSFNAEIAKRNKTLDFEDLQEDRVCTHFHTGGTTGMPKVAQHTYEGMIYNGWIGHRLLFSETDVVMCPLPLFHVFACHVILMAMVASGAHVVFPTPQGYRGEGVFDNMWKLIERWGVTFLITVPTAISAKMQRPIDADLSTVKTAFSGSAPLPMELFKRFEKATGITIVEGYGLTEATVLVSGNPTEGLRKVGSIGVEFPYTKVRIIKGTPEGPIDAEVDEIGEICVSNPGVFAGNTYTEADKNKDLYYDTRYLRTGDLGRKDADGYIWITGRAKDLIIRGGHNIDPAEIEEALLGHEAVAFAGAIGQPDAHAGEVPCAFVELVEGASVTTEELMEFAKKHVLEKAAQPKHMTIMKELPKTAVGKIFKPDLRKSAIRRVLIGALSEKGVDAGVTVENDKLKGLVAVIDPPAGKTHADVAPILDRFALAWRMKG